MSDQTAPAQSITKTRSVQKNNFNLQDFLQKIWTRELPTSQINIKTSQWDKYKKHYKKLRETLDLTASEITQKTTISDYITPLHVLNLSNLGHNLGVNDIANHILVPTNARIAMMSCVDERTQNGEFVDEMNLNGDLLGTISDPTIPRYVLDIPGSGALYCECEKLENSTLTLVELAELEEERLTKLARKIVNWCIKRDVFKFTVTYHVACGAVGLRIQKYNGLCIGNATQVAKQCSLKTAKKISEVANEIGYHLETTVAFIGDRQMSKTGPMEMHNAIGTLACLDSRVLAHKFDQVTKLNFFDSFVYSDFKAEHTTTSEIEGIISDAVRNIKLTIAIANGTHGWGDEQFTSKNPYLVILFANGNDQELEAQKVFQATASKYSAKEIEKLGFYLVRTDK